MDHTAALDSQSPIQACPGEGRGHLLGQGQHQRLKQQREAGELAKPLGLDHDDPTIRQLDPQGSDLQVAFMLEEVKMPQTFGLGVMDRMQPVDRRCGKPAAGDKVDADSQHLAGGVEINTSYVPRFGDAEGGFKELVLHRRALACIAECRTMPAFSNTRLSGPADAVKGSLRRASPAPDRAHRTLRSSPNQPTRISKEAPRLIRQRVETTSLKRYGD